jgi:hypothetical protein
MPAVPPVELHVRVFRRLRSEGALRVWTPGLESAVERALRDPSLYAEHDLGVRPGVESFARLLRALWLEFGALIDAGTLRVTAPPAGGEAPWPLGAGRAGSAVLLVPEDVLAAAALHHALDVALYCLATLPVPAGECEALLGCVCSSIERYAGALGAVVTDTGGQWPDVLAQLVEALAERCEWLYGELSGYLAARGLRVAGAPGLRPPEQCDGGVSAPAAVSRGGEFVWPTAWRLARRGYCYGLERAGPSLTLSRAGVELYCYSPPPDVIVILRGIGESYYAVLHYCRADRELCEKIKSRALKAVCMTRDPVRATVYVGELLVC